MESCSNWAIKMNNFLQTMTSTQVNVGGNQVQAAKRLEDIECVGCDGPHDTNTCSQNNESIAYVKSNPFSNTYNP